MKLFNNKTLMISLILLSGFGYIASCTNENSVVPDVVNNAPKITRGSNVHLPGTATMGNVAEWKMDKTHSSVLWTTAYVGASGELTGRFNMFGLHDVTAAKMQNYTAVGFAQPLIDTSWAFYENEPAKSYFNGYVQINTSNTGEPGRDGGVGAPPGRCNISGTGTTDFVQGVHNLTVTNVAKIKTKSIKFDALSNDYIVTLDLTWQGKLAAPMTKTIVGRLKYIPKAKVQFGTSAAYEVFGLKLTFQFNSRDFGITSTSIADKMEIVTNMNFHNK